MSYSQFGQLLKQDELVRMVLVNEIGDIEFTDIYFFKDIPEVKYYIEELSNLDIELIEIPNEEK